LGDIYLVDEEIYINDWLGINLVIWAFLKEAEYFIYLFRGRQSILALAWRMALALCLSPKDHIAFIVVEEQPCKYCNGLSLQYQVTDPTFLRSTYSNTSQSLVILTIIYPSPTKF
jgi:hypothetical protein